MVKYRVVGQRCLGISQCGVCIARCPGATKEGEDGKSVVIDHEKLEKCGGESVCPMGAIEKVDGKEEKKRADDRMETGFGRGMGQGIGRGGGMGKGFGKGQGMGRGRGGGRMGGFGSGPAGLCICPVCGYEITHQPGQPCNRMRCPECGSNMMRG